MCFFLSTLLFIKLKHHKEFENRFQHIKAQYKSKDKIKSSKKKSKDKINTRKARVEHVLKKGLSLSGEKIPEMSTPAHRRSDQFSDHLSSRLFGDDA